MSRLIDVSLPIGPDLLVWPGDPPVEVVPRLRLAADRSGQQFALNRIQIDIAVDS